MACKSSKICKTLVLLCLLHAASPLSISTHKGVSNVFCAFSGWVPPEGYVPRRLRNEAKDARQGAEQKEARALTTSKTPRARCRRARQGIPWPHDASLPSPRPREVLNSSTVVAAASLVQNTRHENKRLQQEVFVQRQEIANLRMHMSALELEAELRDFWRKEFKEVRYVGNDTFVVAYSLRL